MNLGDPELELIDPTPNVHALFIQFDKTFFWTKLASRAVVRWSKRMYSCAGVCSYEGRGGLCDIALSEPLLKLRPRKDLVETLLHEMIHAYLFITQRDQDRDGHGPNFKEHMYRINKAAGINITIYHSFHDEVELYQTHWWRCNGPCQLRKPHYGIVRRSMNSAPGPRDYWWADHQRKCGGTFIKFKEPEKKNKKTVIAKPPGDITKYITNTKTTKIPPKGEPKIVQISDINSKSNSWNTKTKSNNSNTVVVTQKSVSSPVNPPAVKSPSMLTGKGYTIAGTRVRSNSVDASEAVRNIWAKKQLAPNIVSSSDDKAKVPAIETVRNIWAKKQLTPNTLSPMNNSQNAKGKTTQIPPNNKRVSTNFDSNNVIQKSGKHKADSIHTDSPPMKVKKIDDYFKTNATSLLKDIYGTDIKVVESNNNKLIAVHNTNISNMQIIKVDCPICRLKIEESKINSHLDECLNKDLIAKMCDTNEGGAPQPQVKTELIVNQSNSVVNKVSKGLSTEILNTLPPIPPYKPKPPNNKADSDRKPDLNDNINWNDLKPDISKIKFDPANIDKAKFVVHTAQIDKNPIKSDNFIIPKKESDLQSGNLPFKANDEKAILPTVKVEPGTSKGSAEQKCPCCGSEIAKSIDEHLDECLAFFATDTEPEEASTSFANHTILIDDEDDDIFDESQVFNATGTKLPCPCCLKMVENDDMNAHLDSCLS